MSYSQVGGEREQLYLKRAKYWFELCTNLSSCRYGHFGLGLIDVIEGRIENALQQFQKAKALGFKRADDVLKMLENNGNISDQSGPLQPPIQDTNQSATFSQPIPEPEYQYVPQPVQPAVTQVVFVSNMPLVYPPHLAQPPQTSSPLFCPYVLPLNPYGLGQPFLAPSLAGSAWQIGLMPALPPCNPAMQFHPDGMWYSQ